MKRRARLVVVATGLKTLLCTSAMSRNFGDESGLAPNVETNTQLETAQFREILIKIGAKNVDFEQKYFKIVKNYETISKFCKNLNDVQNGFCKLKRCKSVKIL